MAKKKQPVGRPHTYDQQQANRICELVAQGNSLRSICRDNPDLPSDTTVTRWLQDPDLAEFRVQYHLAYDIQMRLMYDAMRELVDECDVAQIAKVREQISLRKWQLKIHEPKKFGDKPEPAPAPPEAELDLSLLTDEQLTAYEEGVKAATVPPKNSPNA